MSNRIQRVNSLIKNELSQILLKEVDFPKNVLVTITQVEVSNNLSQAKVHISVMLARPLRLAKQGGRVRRSLGEGGPEEQVDRVFKILNRQIYDLQQKLNKRLEMRPIPRIKFVKEEKTSEAARVEELLEEIKEEEKNG